MFEIVETQMPEGAESGAEPVDSPELCQDCEGSGFRGPFGDDPCPCATTTFTREEVLQAVRAAWDEAKVVSHGNPFIALERVLASLGLETHVTTDGTGRRSCVKSLEQNRHQRQLTVARFVAK